MPLIRRAKATGLPFAIVGCERLYRRNRLFRADLDAEQILYLADIPGDTVVYLAPPQVGVLTATPSVEVRLLVTRPEPPEPVLLERIRTKIVGVGRIHAPPADPIPA